MKGSEQMAMFYRVPQNGKHRPQEKRILSTGLVVICEEITEHNPPGATGPSEFTYYTWLETQYSTSEYLSVVDQESDTLKQENTLLKAQAEMHESALNEILFEVLPNITL